MKRIAFGLAALASVFATPASAAQIYDAPFGLAGNQNWGGTLGLNFTVNGAVKITDIGVFDAGSDGLQSGIMATIFDSMGNALFAPIDFAAGTTNAGNAYIFQSIAPLILTSGTYQIAAWGYGSGTEPNFNYGFIQSGDGGPITFDSLGGKLTAVDSYYSFSAGGPGTILDDGNTRYGAGSFIATGVPEASTWAMMILGLGFAGAALRRRKVRIAYA